MCVCVYVYVCACICTYVYVYMCVSNWLCIEVCATITVTEWYASMLCISVCFIVRTCTLCCVHLVSCYAEEEPKAFPAHQPLLDPPTLKAEYNSFLTASREAYVAPTTTPPPAAAEEQALSTSRDSRKQKDQ